MIFIDFLSTWTSFRSLDNERKDISKRGGSKQRLLRGAPSHPHRSINRSPHSDSHFHCGAKGRTSYRPCATTAIMSIRVARGDRAARSAPSAAWANSASRICEKAHYTSNMPKRSRSRRLNARGHRRLIDSLRHSQAMLRPKFENI